MPFTSPKLEAAAHCAGKGLLERLFYNCLIVWEKDLGTEIKENAASAVRHVLLVAFDQEDQMPSGRISCTQKLLAAIEKVDAKFDSIFIPTHVETAHSASSWGDLCCIKISRDSAHLRWTDLIVDLMNDCEAGGSECRPEEQPGPNTGKDRERRDSASELRSPWNPLPERSFRSSGCDRELHRRRCRLSTGWL